MNRSSILDLRKGQQVIMLPFFMEMFLHRFEWTFTFPRTSTKDHIYQTQYPGYCALRYYNMRCVHSSELRIYPILQQRIFEQFYYNKIVVFHILRRSSFSVNCKQDSFPRISCCVTIFSTYLLNSLIFPTYLLNALGCSYICSLVNW